ncbi:protoheme IX farnesyltransferase [Virgibacillus pantothenticus]|uniref:Protoheme IX farnesyltransferase n=1 Tax=Virgibacillus pantothenticus TaxID=1473 RepID=A0A0L0QUM8_VIRPA|nr:heme o synthase [Virgibacillus pantothenticus]KNE22390.1 protoheme IX farnesyltransferase [Virgibacillus pantothenticus]MED3738364.1 heme o synthase [Virgibacillus pantothenticus]QTY16847.1 heme o synthase [Virgibacillus pantothenticus]SIS86285.1 protoheme IX farnesyltransferase [Virgibacillus pantothenticus]GIP63255.1 protoheme IX farnesyltransferase [Virgibacillus pantothenticus]
MILRNKQEESNKNWISILAKTVKLGIIRSNLIPMFAGFTLALYTYEMSFMEKLPEVIFALLGTALVIGAAGAFNNLYDRDIDAIMERTKQRPTVTGQIKPVIVFLLSVIMSISGIALLALTTWLAAVLAFLGLFFYVVPYTMWSKRRTVYNTEIGSISGAMPPLIGWAAVYPDITHPAIIGLFVVMIIWQMPHFYAIAIRNHKQYEAAKIPMLPVVKGVQRTYIQTNVYLVIMIMISFLFGTLSIGLMLVALLLSAGWLTLSVFRYHRVNAEKWATSMFLYSLVHMTVLFSTVIIYSLMGIIFEL